MGFVSLGWLCGTFCTSNDVLTIWRDDLLTRVFLLDSQSNNKSKIF